MSEYHNGLIKQDIASNSATKRVFMVTSYETLADTRFEQLLHSQEEINTEKLGVFDLQNKIEDK